MVDYEVNDKVWARPKDSIEWKEAIVLHVDHFMDLRGQDQTRIEVLYDGGKEREVFGDGDDVPFEYDHLIFKHRQGGKRLLSSPR